MADRTIRWFRWGRSIAALCLVGALASCQAEEANPATGSKLEPVVSAPGYVLDTTPVTSNAGSSAGVISGAAQLVARVLPGVYVAGPSGQMIPNTDLATTQVLPGTNRRVVYSINQAARWSDGSPVTCTDFELAIVAGQNKPLFDSLMPLTQEIESADCAEPTSRRITVVFKEGTGARWRWLFGPGQILPSQAIASKLGIDDGELLNRMSTGSGLEEIAHVWNEGFDLNSLDKDLQLSHGPYVIDQVGEHGEVILERNDTYWGDKPNIDRIAVWPGSVDPGELATVGENRIVAAESHTAEVPWVDRDSPKNPYTMSSVQGQLTDSLLFDPFSAGFGKDAALRQGIAACVDQRQVAQASSTTSGIEVAPTGLHVVSHDDPAAGRLDQISQSRIDQQADVASRVEGHTLTVGYHGSSERRKAIVKAIADSCRPFGLQVKDVGDDENADAWLEAVDPYSMYGGIGDRGNIAELRDAENLAWDDSSIVPLSSQPRTFVTLTDMGNVSVYTGATGIGWNMDRWKMKDNGER